MPSTPKRVQRLVILGHPIAHSLSPVFQNAALQHAQIPLRYEAVDVSPNQLDDVLRALALENAGGNVTIPHKESVAARARCTALAERVGAVNTFWHVDGVLHGHNTDVEGMVAAIAAVCNTDLTDMRVAVLGAGGAAAAVLVALDALGCRSIQMAARTPQRAVDMARRVNVAVHIAAAAEAAVAHADLVINATPVGLTDNCMPVSPTALAAGAVVIDLICRPQKTALVRACENAGHVAVDGRVMLLEQGAAAFECWFGVDAPVAVMGHALEDEFRRRTRLAEPTRSTRKPL